jgi:hypothetical protein
LYIEGQLVKFAEPGAAPDRGRLLWFRAPLLRAAAAAGELIRSGAGGEQQIMKCPKCSADMIGGKLAVHGTFWGFLFLGWSYQPCWWQPGGDPGKEEKLIEANGAREAFRCASCRMIIIPEA